MADFLKFSTPFFTRSLFLRAYHMCVANIFYACHSKCLKLTDSEFGSVT
jgi:hypothetical protein